MGIESTTVVMARRSEEQAFEVQLALAGFLTGYSGNTRLAYQQDLRQFVSWCSNQNLGLLDVRRTHIELFARWLEHRGAARATIGRRLSTVTGFYRVLRRRGTPHSQSRSERAATPAAARVHDERTGSQ